MNWAAILIGTSSLFAGIGLMAWAYITHQRGKRSLEWPDVEGTVMSSGVSTSYSDSDSDSTSGPTYFPAVAYQYRVGGETFESGQIGIGGAVSASQQGAADIAAQYEVGKKVRVYYDPAKPAYAVLKRGSSKYLVWAITAGGVVSILIAAIVMFTSVRL